MTDIQLAILAVQHRGWTLSAIADAMGVARWSAARWRRGENPSNQRAVLVLLHSLLAEPVPKKRRYHRGLV